MWTAGMGFTTGRAKIRETRSMGLCVMYPAQTARSSTSLIRMRTRLRVALFPARSRVRTVWITRGAEISSIWRLPSGSMMYRSMRRFSS